MRSTEPEKIELLSDDDKDIGSGKLDHIGFVPEGRTESIQEIHNKRSERAKDMDRRQNTPTTTRPRQWLDNPNRYDYSGVDTIDCGI
jgi:hypothetical protein